MNTPIWNQIELTVWTIGSFWDLDPNQWSFGKMKCGSQLKCKGKLMSKEERSEKKNRKKNLQNYHIITKQCSVNV